MNNSDIKILFQANGIRQWEIAKLVGYSEAHFSRLLRYELKPELKERIVSAVELLVQERNK